MSVRDLIPGDGLTARSKPGKKLSNAYNETNVPPVRRRLCQARLRLPWVLNEALSDD